MSDLPTIVLLVGLVGGVVFAWMAMRGKSSRTTERLRLADLNLQLNELYQELRNEGLRTSERRTLEERAARTLRALRSLEASRPDPKPAPAAPGNHVADPREPVSFTRRHPVLVGAVLGGGMVGLVAILVGLAFRDTGLNSASGPVPASSSMPGGSASGAASAATPEDGNFRGEPQLPPIVAQQVAALREQLVLSPTDLSSRHQLLELLLAHEQHFDAFQEANTLLEISPNDPVGHYAAGFVRFIMGQVEPALEHLGTAVDADPAYTQAWLVRGLILLQTGAREQATAAWTNGLQAAGGTEPRLEHLLAQTARGLSFEEVVQQPPP